ncbi:unnamed protein product [Mytilus coruscus]|uniref:Uncharacterized protein n=1 Tax=Mytilus coruscus TaxID=42192 RepID=A0A6J8DSD0_MYTCO|nr:unnamed protein product [Mytilus coruscus]
MNMSNIDEQIAEISRQIQSLSESTIQHGQSFISSTPRDQGVRPKVVENREHDSGVVMTGPSLSTPNLFAKEQFIDALEDSEMRLRIKQSRPKGLNDAIRFAVELEATTKLRFGITGHFARNCPNNNQKQSTLGTDNNGSYTDGTVNTLKFSNNDKDVVVVSASEDAGMFVELSIQDVPVKFVVDTELH